MTPPTPSPAPSPERARLAAALRELKARTGLSLAGLAEQTPFSKSSWDRYLKGGTLPPRQAVRELCRLADEPDGRCLALWEIAESEWSGRVTPAPSRAPAPAPPSEEVTRTGHWSAAAVAVLASVCAVAVGGMAVALFLLPGQDAEPRPSTPQSPTATGPRCRGADCEGKSPMHMKCSVGPDTLASHRTATGAWMELRYSEKCGASWARMWDTRVGDRIEMTVGGGSGRTRGVRSAKVEDEIDAESYVYTPMTATRPGTAVRACLRPAANDETECFNARVR